MVDNISPATAGKQGKAIETGEMTIRGHLLRLPHIVIQISNISGITASEVQMRYPGSAISIAGLITGVIGGILMKISNGYFYYNQDQHNMGALILMIGILVFILGNAAIVVSKRKCLNIYLNCGITHSIAFGNETFMYEVLDMFSNIFEGGGTVENEVKISIQDCKFIGDTGINTGAINS